MALAALVLCLRRSAPSFERRCSSALTKLEAAQVDHDERLESIASSLKRLHSRAGMREVREQRANGRDTSVPDPATEPEAWKRHMRAKHGLFPFKKSED